MGRLYTFFKRFSVAVFGEAYEKYNSNFDSLKPHLTGAGIDMPLKTWACMALMSASISFFALLAGAIALSALTGAELVLAAVSVTMLPPMAAAATFFVFYLYPIQKTNSRKNSIETDMPFALAHMNAIARSGIPPEFMFEMLTDFEEYGEISRHAKTVVRNIRVFGMSSVKAINAVADRTPSEAFRQVLAGMTATISKGGNLVDYLNQMSDKAMFDYSIRREKYLKTLSTYADIYTALLVAAPLMLLAVLGVMSLIGGTVLGLSIPDLILLLTWVVLPAVNVSFLAFVHVTYPGV